MSFKNTHLPVPRTLQSGGRLLDCTQPLVMGILNATPDSFYNKGRDAHTDSLLQKAAQMLADGAAILDVGGASTRPGAAPVGAEEELDRILPAIMVIKSHFPDVWLSVDTYHASVARAAVIAGANIINDISAGDLDTTMLQTVASLKVPYIAMHMQGTPATMQQSPQYNDVVTEVFDHLRQRMQQCYAAGITDVIIDPGFGFGKTTAHNYALLNNLSVFRAMGCIILAGISRKGMVWKPLSGTPETALNGTTALHMAALQQGAGILRVHDVGEAVEVIKLWGQL